MVPAYKALEIFVDRMIELKQNADAFIVTGYPRNMRDVVEYLARVYCFYHLEWTIDKLIDYL